MQLLKDQFDFLEHEVIAIIGSGGKTSLLAYLAQSYRLQKVLVATTTKMAYPFHFPIDRFGYDKTCVQSGITAVGQKLLAQAKITYPTEVQFSKQFNQFDKVILECDGAKRKLLKGWAAFEPVIPEETTTTIGVLPIKALNKPLSNTYIHRLALFLELITAKNSNNVTIPILQDIIMAKGGLFQKALGRNILFINQVETTTELAQAEKLVTTLDTEFCSRNLVRIIAGSSLRRQGVTLWGK